MGNDYGSITLAAAQNEFLTHCRHERRLDEKTITAYKTDLKQFAERFHDGIKIRAITREDVRSWISSLSKYRYKTIKRKVASYGVFMQYLEDAYEGFERPVRRVLLKMKAPVGLPTVMSSSEVGCVLEEVNKRVCDLGASPKQHILAIRNRAIIELLFGTGMRIGELCGLRNVDVDLRQGKVRIHGKGNKERVVDICTPAILDAQLEWCHCHPLMNAADGYYFISRSGRRMEPQSIRILVHQLAKACNIHKRVTPHTFRHTFASLLLEENVDIAIIQQILGHSSILTTQIYLHVNPLKQRDVLTRQHPRNRL